MSDALSTSSKAVLDFFRARPLWQKIAIVLWLVLALVGAANLLLYAERPANSTKVSPNASTESSVVATAASGGIIPTRLMIPAIGVNAPVQSVGVTKEGAMDTPSNFYSAAWYKLGSAPGASGNAVIDGHVNNALTEAGVFEHLNQVKLGDAITITDASGATRVFKVTSMQLYDADAASTSQIFATNGAPQLVLITCDGAWDQGKREFDKRLVVYAALAS